MSHTLISETATHRVNNIYQTPIISKHTSQLRDQIPTKANLTSKNVSANAQSHIINHDSILNYAIMSTVHLVATGMCMGTKFIC